MRPVDYRHGGAEPIINKWADDKKVLKRVLQREVADRLVAKAGTKAYGVLSVSAQVHTDITRLLNLPPGAFRPAWT